MKTTLTSSMFHDAFKSFARDNFSYEGLNALFAYLEDYEESTKTQIELDVVALCCEFTEYENLAEIMANYTNIKSREDLEDHTTVIDIPGTERLIIVNF